MPTTNAQDSRIRRAAARKGYALVKSRQRSIYAQNQPAMWLVDPTTSNGVVAGPFYDYDDVAEELATR